MNGYDFTAGCGFEGHIPNESSQFVLLCGSGDVRDLMKTFNWAEDTVEECSNLDETIRYTSYDGYDFISLIYAEPDNEYIAQNEINLFISKEYLVVVFPENPGARLTVLVDALSKALPSAVGRNAPLIYLYYAIFDSLAKDFSNIFEELEDKIEALSESISERLARGHSRDIAILRKTAYTYKKLMRAFSYIGGQILVDENNLLDKSQIRYFRNVDSRLIKLHDFADHLFELSHELLNTYDSKLSAQTNDSVNKLTVITLFFGPLSVIAGIYGMNFTHMPELRWQYGYPAALGLMGLVSLIIYFVLKKKKWL